MDSTPQSARAGSDGLVPSEGGLLPPPASPPDDIQPSVARLPLWQRRYLAAIQAGVDRRDAELAAHVSTATVLDYLDRSPTFANAHARAIAGVAVLGREAARDLAAAQAPSLIGHFARQAREAPHVRDQVAAGRLVLESAGVVGERGPTVAVQVNVADAVLELAARRRQERSGT